MDLFEPEPPPKSPRHPPLAERMRPRNLAEFVGQSHLVGPGRILPAALHGDPPPSLILWGPPGSGKTTLARIVAQETGFHFVFFSAVLAGVKEVRELVREARMRRDREGRRTILFVDEIHRFNRGQQDAFLPHVEDGTLILIGATTENPSFEVTAPLLSRCKVLVLHPLSPEQIVEVLRRALADPEQGLGSERVDAAPELLLEIARWAEGDARRALNLLEVAAVLDKPKDGSSQGRAIYRTILTSEAVREAAQNRMLRFDRDREEHYNVISAFIKSLRGSDPDAAVYWLARMLEAGEDPLFVARRMVIFASEDVGNADPQALGIAVAALQAFHAVGMPEGWIPLAQAATYLATAPKSNASYRAYRRAVEEIEQSGSLPVPLHLRNAPTPLMKNLGYGEGYRYPHDYPDATAPQGYLPEGLVEPKASNKKENRFYEPKEQGHEKVIRERMERRRKGRTKE